jgi:hypothetical protein
MLHIAIYLAFTKYAPPTGPSNWTADYRTRFALKLCHPTLLKEWKDHVRQGGTFKVLEDGRLTIRMVPALVGPLP